VALVATKNFRLQNFELVATLIAAIELDYSYTGKIEIFWVLKVLGFNT